MAIVSLVQAAAKMGRHVRCVGDDNVYANIEWLDTVENGPAPDEPTLATTVVNETPGKTARKAIRNAEKFGHDLVEKFAAENVLLGITQAGMTESVLDNMGPVTAAISTGSLYLARGRIDDLIADTAKHDATFITPARLQAAKDEITAFLGG